MKTSSVIAISAALLLIPFISNSYAQSEKQSSINLLLQLEIRDASGYLVGFIESDRTTIINYEILSNFLDENWEALDKRNFTIDDQQLEIFTAVGITTHLEQTVYSHSVISGSDGIVAEANHDGFLINPGDNTISTWTIIRVLP